MRRLSALFGTTLFVLLAATASQARADFWTYTSNPNVAGVSVGSTSPGGGASVTLTDFSTAQPGATSIPVIAYVTSTALTSPITFGPSVNTPSTYSLAVTFTDSTTHDSGTLNFTGSIAGTLSATTSTLVNTLTPVTSNSLTLDGFKYTLSIPPMMLAPPTSPQQNITGTVSVTPVTGGGNPGGGNPGGSNPGGPIGGGGGVSTAPEPASLVLGTLGFSCFGLGCLWNRRSQRLTKAA
jgi:hypothetical protein